MAEQYAWCDPEEWAQCLSLDPERGYLCTRELGHADGPHVAHEAGTLAVVQVWTEPAEEVNRGEVL